MDGDWKAPKRTTRRRLKTIIPSPSNIWTPLSYCWRNRYQQLLALQDTTTDVDFNIMTEDTSTYSGLLLKYMLENNAGCMERNEYPSKLEYIWFKGQLTKGLINCMGKTNLIAGHIHIVLNQEEYQKWVINTINHTHWPRESSVLNIRT